MYQSKRALEQERAELVSAQGWAEGWVCYNASRNRQHMPDTQLGGWKDTNSCKHRHSHQGSLVAPLPWQPWWQQRGAAWLDSCGFQT